MDDDSQLCTCNCSLNLLRSQPRRNETRSFLERMLLAQASLFAAATCRSSQFEGLGFLIPRECGDLRLNLIKLAQLQTLPAEQYHCPYAGKKACFN